MGFQTLLERKLIHLNLCCCFFIFRCAVTLHKVPSLSFDYTHFQIINIKSVYILWLYMNEHCIGFIYSYMVSIQWCVCECVACVRSFFRSASLAFLLLLSFFVKYCHSGLSRTWFAGLRFNAVYLYLQVSCQYSINLGYHKIWIFFCIW